jgi:predicted DNA-binding transcriptional regulator AlpA
LFFINVAAKNVSEEQVAIGKVELMPGKMLDVGAVADRLSISERSVWRTVADGLLPAPVKIGRCSRWFPADIATFERSLIEQREQISRTASKRL